MRLDLFVLVRLLAVVSVAGILAAGWLSMGSGNGSGHGDNLTAIKTPGYSLPALQLFPHETTGARSPESEEQ